MARQSQRLCWSFTINNYVSDDGEEETFSDALCSYLIEAHEVGESGTPHIQGYCQLKTAMTLNQMKAICPTAHFEVARGTPYQNFLYCAKGEQSHAEWHELKEEGPNYGKNAEFLEWGPRPKAPVNAHKKKPKDTTYHEALAAPTVREGMAIIQAKQPRDFCLHAELLERSLKKAKVAPATASKFLITDFNRLPLDLSKSVLLTGLSGSGKTQWALAHFKNPLFVSHIDKLKILSPDHDGIVFDDMAFDHWPVESVIHLLDMDMEREIHLRYGNATIPAYTRKIFTTNKPNPFYKPDVDPDQKVAIERRYLRVEVKQPLFGVDTIMPQAINDAYAQMIGAHLPLPPHYDMPERFPIHDGCQDQPIADYGSDIEFED